MSWFNKKKDLKNERSSSKLPELPKLPKFSQMKDSGEKKMTLPTLPKSSFEQNFSQEGQQQFVPASKKNENNKLEGTQISSPPVRKPLRKEILEEPPKAVVKEKDQTKPEKKTGPIFIRIDKFKESLELFENIKEKIEELKEHLENTKKLKEEEEKSLTSWEIEIQKIKKQIEQIDKNIFSKVE